MTLIIDPSLPVVDSELSSYALIVTTHVCKRDGSDNLSKEPETVRVDGRDKDIVRPNGQQSHADSPHIVRLYGRRSYDDENIVRLEGRQAHTVENICNTPRKLASVSTPGSMDKTDEGMR